MHPQVTNNSMFCSIPNGGHMFYSSIVWPRAFQTVSMVKKCSPSPPCSHGVQGRGRVYMGDSDKQFICLTKADC